MKRLNSSVWVNDNHLQWNYSHCPSTFLMIHSFNKPGFYLLFQITMEDFILCLGCFCFASFCALSHSCSFSLYLFALKDYLCCWNRRQNHIWILSLNHSTMPQQASFFVWLSFKSLALSIFLWSLSHLFCSLPLFILPLLFLHLSH